MSPLRISRRSLVGGAVAGTAMAAVPRSAAAAAPRETLFGSPPGVARLMYNENPYGPSPAAKRAMVDAMATNSFYTGVANDRLRQMIGRKLGVDPAQVVLGDGSTELLCAATLAWGRKGAIVMPELTYDDVVEFAETKGARVIRIPMRSDLGIDLRAMADAVGPDVALVHICNPNNPTGMLLDNGELRSFIDRVSGHAVVLVDEAYNEITDDPRGNSVVDLVRAGKNVVVFRTFSKIFGMAGLRLGYAIAQPAHAELIASYCTNLGGNVPALAAAIASYDDESFINFSKSKILEGRALIQSAAKSAALEVAPSQANFVFVRVPDANALKEQMEGRGILIRGSYGDKWRNWSRVSAGKIEEVRRYAALLPQLAGERSG